MTPPRRSRDQPAFVRVEPRRGPGLAIVVALLAVIVVGGLLGRLVPERRLPVALEPGASSAAPASGPADRFTLSSPIDGVTWRRTTSIRVSGTADPALGAVEVVLAPSRLLPGVAEFGRTTIAVDAEGAFRGALDFAPPYDNWQAVLDVSPVDQPEVLLASVTFPLESGSMVLPRDAARLRGRPGGVLVVDVLVYGEVARLRGLLTGRDGILIARVERRLARAAAGAVRDVPRTFALELPIPTTGVPPRGTLHLLGIDRDGMEIEHIDATVLFDSR